MTRNILIVLIVLVFKSVFAQKVPTAEILTNTYRIETNDSTGTCFLVRYHEREFIITARHLLSKSTKSGDLISFQLDQGDILIPYMGNVYIGDKNYDVAVIQIAQNISHIKTYSTKGEFRLGQDCYFLGFPYFPLSFSTKMNGGRIAMIKKAIISAIYTYDGNDLYLLDGHNNPGFSGGPVVAWDNTVGDFFIVGVVSGYYPQRNKGELGIDSLTNVEFKYEENSGIIISVPSRYFIEIIDEQILNK